MKKLMTGLVLAALVMIPLSGLTAETASTPAERAAKAVASTEAAYQKGLATQSTIQQESEQASANLAKAESDLKLAEASGDKEKIKAARAELAKARYAVAEANRKLKALAGLVEKLKLTLEKAKAAAEQVKQAKTDDEANAAALQAERAAARAAGILKAVENSLKPSGRLELKGMTIPTTTTSTTQPSPTPVGKRG
ncbi:MAG: hypothetical protein WCO77_12330 [bacterium]